jgi:peptidoglycan hydrolase-like protein with peptidoglycan-binding domain
VDYRAQVKSVQLALNARGYDAGPADGALGPRTRSAIRSYQVASGLTSNGAIDAGLLQSLGVAANSTQPGVPVGSTLIAAIEDALMQRGYAAGAVDGVLDKQARSAIAQYQKDAGLTVTGQASSTLLDSLSASSVRNDSDTLSQQVWQVEVLLGQKGYKVGPIDGTLDTVTRKGIEDYQEDAGLKVNGKVSNKLLASLQDAEVSGGSDGGSINQLTARQVWELEVRLDALGYDVGTVDQVADSKTHAGVLAYQRDHGLPPTGRIDQPLLLHLQQADASQQRNWSDLSGEEKGLVIMESLIKAVGPQLQ